MKEELEQCPFCGGKAEAYSNLLKGNSSRYEVICGQYCGAMVQAKQKRWAIRAWNTRTVKVSRKSGDREE